MDPIQNTIRMPREERVSFTRRVIQLALGIPLMALLAGPAFAQYGGGGTMGGGSSTGTYTPPKGGYGNGKAIGIGIGAAAGAGVLFWTLHHRARPVTGCVEPANDGLALLDEKSGQTYSLMPGDTDLKSGQRVELKGKAVKNDSGAQVFQAKKIVKDFGACGSSQSAVSSLRPSSE